MLSFGSLFSGIGGLDLGLERAGMRCAWQVEIDPFCRAVLARHWPDTLCFEDVRHVGRNELATVDLVCGGFPCQPVSLAGKRNGHEDPRWLWPEFARILGELRPQYAVLENVPGLRTKGFGQVLGDLARHGYDAEWASIPAAAVGAPHLRYRIFIVAFAQGFGRQRRDSISSTAFSDGRFCPEGNHRQTGNVADADLKPLVWTTEPWRECHTWPVEPNVGRMAYGVPRRVDRLRALGNAVVPQVAEWIGRRIIEADGAGCAPVPV